MISWHRLHRIGAAVVVVFVVAHITNHLFALGGYTRHDAVLQQLRAVYRHPLIEPVLLIAVLAQTVSGLSLAIRGLRRPAPAVRRLQQLSGLYLSGFLLIHVSAVLGGRWIAGLDTNFYFAAAGLQVPPWHWFFAPYYGLAVTAVFAHLGCALHARLGRRPGSGSGNLMLSWPLAGTLLGTGLAVLIVSTLFGFPKPLTVPNIYTAPFELIGANVQLMLPA